MIVVNALTMGYSIVLVLISAMYKKVAGFLTDSENYRYKGYYDNALIDRLFMFNSLTFFVPMYLIAVDS